MTCNLGFFQEIVRYQYRPVVTRFLWSRHLIFSDFRDLMIILSESGSLTRLPKPLWKNPDIIAINYIIHLFVICYYFYNQTWISSRYITAWCDFMLCHCMNLEFFILCHCDFGSWVSSLIIGRHGYVSREPFAHLCTLYPNSPAARTAIVSKFCYVLACLPVGHQKLCSVSSHLSTK